MLTHRIPVVYSPNRISPPPDGYISFAIRPRARLQYLRARLRTPTAPTSPRSTISGPPYLFCITRAEITTPPGTRFEITQRKTHQRKRSRDARWPFNTATLLVDGQPRGQFVSASVQVLPPWPHPLIGCFLNRQPGGVAVHQAVSSRIAWRSTPCPARSSAVTQTPPLSSSPSTAARRPRSQRLWKMSQSRSHVPAPERGRTGGG